MQQALQHKIVIPKSLKKNKKIRSKKANVFNLIMTLTIIFFSIALVRVVQYALYNQYALENEQLRTKIASVEQTNQELASKKLSFESPQRIESLAKNKLKMIKPQSVRYIVYREPVKPRMAYVKK